MILVPFFRRNALLSSGAGCIPASSRIKVMQTTKIGLFTIAPPQEKFGSEQIAKLTGLVSEAKKVA